MMKGDDVMVGFKPRS